ncbi:unnamed protein product, partial [marine sediment metagenome]
APETRQEAPEIRQEAPEIRQEAPEIGQEAPEIRQEAPEIGQEAPEIGQEAPEISEDIDTTSGTSRWDLDTLGGIGLGLVPLALLVLVVGFFMKFGPGARVP